jgi:hypothetical protein
MYSFYSYLVFVVFVIRLYYYVLFIKKGKKIIGVPPSHALKLEFSKEREREREIFSYFS